MVSQFLIYKFPQRPGLIDTAKGTPFKKISSETLSIFAGIMAANRLLILCLLLAVGPAFSHGF